MDLFAETDIDYGSSDVFSETEIDSAIHCIGEWFQNFPGAEMIKIWYDEEQSNKELQRFFADEPDCMEGITDENKIILFSEFHVDERGMEGSLNPNFTYENWMWILVRENKESPWEIWSFGY